MVKSPSHNWPNHSFEIQIESSPYDDLNPRKPTQSHFPNGVYSTNNVIIPPIVNYQIFHVVDSPTTNHDQQIDLEHPDLDRTSVGNNVKGKEPISKATHYESSTSQPTIKDEDLCLEIVAHSLQVSYKF